MTSKILQEDNDTFSDPIALRQMPVLSEMQPTPTLQDVKNRVATQVMFVPANPTERLNFSAWSALRMCAQRSYKIMAFCESDEAVKNETDRLHIALEQLYDDADTKPPIIKHTDDTIWTHPAKDCIVKFATRVFRKMAGAGKEPSVRAFYFSKQYCTVTFTKFTALPEELDMLVSIILNSNCLCVLCMPEDIPHNSVAILNNIATTVFQSFQREFVN